MFYKQHVIYFSQKYKIHDVMLVLKMRPEDVKMPVQGRKTKQGQNQYSSDHKWANRGKLEARRPEPLRIILVAFCHTSPV